MISPGIMQAVPHYERCRPSAAERAMADQALKLMTVDEFLRGTTARKARAGRRPIQTMAHQRRIERSWRNPSRLQRCATGSRHAARQKTGEPASTSSPCGRPTLRLYLPASRRVHRSNAHRRGPRRHAHPRSRAQASRLQVAAQRHRDLDGRSRAPLGAVWRRDGEGWIGRTSWPFTAHLDSPFPQGWSSDRALRRQRA